MFPYSEDNSAIAKRIFLNKLEDASYFPKYFEIETVRACNARCIMCSVEQWEKEKEPIMDMDLFHKFVKEVSEYSDWIETICLNRDGEPTLDKLLPVRIRLLKEVGIKKVTFSTNGQLLTSELCEQLIDAGLDDIMISLDGFSKESFEKIRRGLSYETVVDNTKKIISLRDQKSSSLTIRIRMVVMQENKHELSEWLNYWSNHIKDGDKVYAMPMHSWGNQTELETLEAIEKYADKPCVSPFSTIIMHVNGKIGLCGVDYNSRYLMGDFSRQTLKEIWQGTEFTRARDYHATKRRNKYSLCRGCNLWDRQYEQ